MILGIIPARAGSRRLPGKNTRMLHGKPMIAYTIEAAQRSALLDRFIVATEDGEIAQVATDFGAETYLRPPEMATDEASVYDTIHKILDDIEATWVVLLQPTSPLRNEHDIDACIGNCLFNAAPACIATMHQVPVPNGSVYVAFVTWLREHRNFDGPRTVVHQMPMYRSVDVNTLEDFERAEALMRP